VIATVIVRDLGEQEGDARADQQGKRKHRALIDNEVATRVEGSKLLKNNKKKKNIRKK
jgi:hypothetical protein